MLLLRPGQGVLFSSACGEDRRYGLEQVVRVLPEQRPIRRCSSGYAGAWLRRRVLGVRDAFDRLAFGGIVKEGADLALCSGGDNYCYGEPVHIYLQNDLLRRACSIVVVYLTLGAMATLAICAMQPEFTLQQVLIEVFSAIDTVGLTAGITRQLNTASRVLLILLMYAGRLGSMTFMILLTRRKPPAPVQYPTDKILVG